MVTAGKPAQKVVFKIVPGARVRKGDAEAIGREFEKIRASGRALTAETVLAVAADARSVLHKYVTWDDRAAAHQYRLEQARGLLRSIEIIVEDKGKRGQLRAFYSVRDVDGQRSYQPAEYVFANAETSDQIIREAKQQLESWMARFKRYQWAKGAVPSVIAALKIIKTSAKKPRKRKP